LRVVLATVITGAALLAGGFFLGYAYSEWWEAKRPIRLEGWVVATVDLISGARYVGPDTEIITTDRLAAAGGWEGYLEGGLRTVGALPDGWLHVGTIVFEFYWGELPARTRTMGVYDLIPTQDPVIRMTYELYAEPAVKPARSLHDIARSAQYVVGWSETAPGERQAYAFAAADGPAAMARAADLMWHLDNPRRDRWLAEHRDRGGRLIMFE